MYKKIGHTLDNSISNVGYRLRGDPVNSTSPYLGSPPFFVAADSVGDFVDWEFCSSDLVKL